MINKLDDVDDGENVPLVSTDAHNMEDIDALKQVKKRSTSTISQPFGENVNLLPGEDIV